MIVEAVRPCAYLDIDIDSKPVGRIVVELKDDLAPIACKNFLASCNHKSYQHNHFHRTIKNFVIQAGDLVYGQSSNLDVSKIGQGSKGGPFEDENASEPLDSPFMLCMANDGTPNNNGSQFFITTYPQPHLTGKHTVFGRVIHGKSVVREIERVDTDSKNFPTLPVVITDCGEWEEGMPVPIFNASYDQRGGDIYEEYPDDDVHIDKESSKSVYEASSKIKQSGTLLFQAGDKEAAMLKYKKCLRYVMEYIPDQDQEPEWYKLYFELKIKLYLNLSLVYLQLKNYTSAVAYSTYLIEMDESVNLISKTDYAKAHSRKGTALIELKKYTEAARELTTALKYLPNDKGIAKELERAELLLQKKKDGEKAKYANFFK
ncbi:peptidyl-prolyl cis-trans isomerase D [[Candida] railenensis]|uniref:peptidylprolyl isomerase n=1 Tax=[Candida] railenensis TaxID=45579 RepID=A0A9P0QQF1_9ASCO|nr:peptidyl-prolyl cis-trans isomerase D [[Candida] railenensis]